MIIGLDSELGVLDEGVEVAFIVDMIPIDVDVTVPVDPDDAGELEAEGKARDTGTLITSVGEERRQHAVLLWPQHHSVLLMVPSQGVISAVWSDDDC